MILFKLSQPKFFQMTLHIIFALILKIQNRLHTITVKIQIELSKKVDYTALQQNKEKFGLRSKRSYQKFHKHYPRKKAKHFINKNTEKATFFGSES